MSTAAHLERRLLDAIEDHAHEYAEVQVPDHEFGDPTEIRDLATGETFMVEVRVMPTGG